jgi:peptidyl-prolyl cis-trans isomerase D
MATLEKIRSKGVLLIVVVGVALLSFIIGDFLTNGSSVRNKSRETVAEINGEKINIAEYQELLDQITVFQKYESRQENVDEQTMQQMRAYVWDQLVREKLLLEEAEKMGLTITPEELSDRLIGNNIHPLIQQRQFFADESGRFNRSMLLQFLNFKDEEATDNQMAQSLEEYKKLWIFLEKTVKFALLQEKYNSLVANALVSNSVEAKLNFDLNSVVVNANYVVQPYFSIPDSAVKVTDKEIKDRYNARLKLYRQEPAVSMKLVTFRVQPSEEDYKEAEEFINGLREEFSKTDEVTELVNRNSDITYNGTNYTRNTVPFAYREFAFNGNVGDVSDPMFINNAYTMGRIMQTGINLPDSVRLRHIFLVTADEPKLDSIMGAIRGGADFGALARKYSAVKQTADNNGEIGWIMDGDPSLDKEIMQNAMTKKANELFTFKNAQGTQIIQIMEQTPARQKVKLAILERSVIASSKTEGKIFNDAKRFAAGLKAEMFDSLANKNNYQVRLANDVLQSNPNVLDIPQSRQIIRWAFENGKGKVSDVFECEKQFVVATVTDLNESKYRPLNAVADQIKNELLNDKKAEKIIANLKDKVGNDTSLVALASSIGQEVKQAQGVSFGAFQFGLAGFEPAVIGKTVSMQQNQVSAPVKGNAGVYVVAATSVSKTPGEFNAVAEKQSMRSRFSFSAPNAILMDMRDKADITDNRLNFY